MLYYLKNKNFLLGLGLGLIIASLLLYPIRDQQLEDTKIEEMARQLGMKYPEEIRAFFENDNK